MYPEGFEAPPENGPNAPGEAQARRHNRGAVAAPGCHFSAKARGRAKADGGGADYGRGEPPANSE